MSPQEVEQRAKLAAEKFAKRDEDTDRCRYNRGCLIAVAKQALLDASLPLPVDRDLADLRELWASKVEGHGHTLESRAYRKGDYDEALRAALPTLRAIIQRRIEEAGR